MLNMAEKLNQKIKTMESPIVVGLDPVLSEIPMCYKKPYENYVDTRKAVCSILYEFNKDIINSISQNVGEFMTREEIVNFWIETSDGDYNTMKHMFDAKDYHWSLFIGHLVIEKLIKAAYAKIVEDYKTPLYSHDLLYLAEKAELQLTDELKKKLAVITTFNIQARYPDYKKAFYDKCTRDFSNEQIKNIEEVRIWLKEQLKEQPSEEVMPQS